MAVLALSWPLPTRCVGAAFLLHMLTLLARISNFSLVSWAFQ
jgi:hypothetical protein